MCASWLKSDSYIDVPRFINTEKNGAFYLIELGIIEGQGRDFESPTLNEIYDWMLYDNHSVLIFKRGNLRVKRSNAKEKFESAYQEYLNTETTEPLKNLGICRIRRTIPINDLFFNGCALFGAEGGRKIKTQLVAAGDPLMSNLIELWYMQCIEPEWLHLVSFRDHMHTNTAIRKYNFPVSSDKKNFMKSFNDFSNEIPRHCQVLFKRFFKQHFLPYYPLNRFLERCCMKADTQHGSPKKLETETFEIFYTTTLYPYLVSLTTVALDNILKGGKIVWLK